MYAQEERERKTAEQGPSNREGRCTSWKKKGKKDGKPRRIGGGLAGGDGGGGGVLRVYRGDGNGVGGLPERGRTGGR